MIIRGQPYRTIEDILKSLEFTYPDMMFNYTGELRIVPHSWNIVVFIPFDGKAKAELIFDTAKITIIGDIIEMTHLLKDAVIYQRMGQSNNLSYMLESTNTNFYENDAEINDF